MIFEQLCQDGLNIIRIFVILRDASKKFKSNCVRVIKILFMNGFIMNILICSFRRDRCHDYRLEFKIFVNNHYVMVSSAFRSFHKSLISKILTKHCNEMCADRNTFTSWLKRTRQRYPLFRSRKMWNDRIRKILDLQLI